jgi:hypothetical protein
MIPNRTLFPHTDNQTKQLSLIESVVLFDENMVNSLVKEHYNGKLKLLASFQCMQTIPGWIYAQVLDREIVKCLEDDKKHNDK